MRLIYIFYNSVNCHYKFPPGLLMLPHLIILYLTLKPTDSARVIRKGVSLAFRFPIFKDFFYFSWLLKETSKNVMICYGQLIIYIFALYLMN